MIGQEKSAQQPTPPLEPLYPRAEPSKHDYYIGQLRKALLSSDSKLRNIALSGVYGSGKSSIIEGATSNLDNVRKISLAPLAAQIKSVSQQEDDNHNSDSQTDWLTNRIQKEIVKQLLYGTSPNVIPLSRFHRIRESKVSEKLLQSALLGIVFFLILVPLLNLSGLIQWDKNPWLGLLAYSCVLIIACLVAGMLVWPFADRIHLKQFSLGSTSFGLDDKVDSYFDQFLDEIVYLFEKTGIQIVVFEDLDRFNDSRIFDSLHELNQILNSDSIMAHAGGTPIRFVYAIKDSVFDDQYVGGDKPSNNKQFRITQPFARTKFFDLIIPVVPFISPSNSYQIALDALHDVIADSGVTELLELVATSIPDKRTWLNIRNEFIVYQKEILGESGVELGLDSPHLLAFNIYKNCYLDDSVNLQSGKSILDYTYDAARQIADAGLQEQYKLLQKTEERLHLSQTDQSLENRAIELGETLKSALDQLQANHEANSIRISTDINSAASSNNSTDISVWQSISNLAESDPILIYYQTSYPVYPLQDNHWIAPTKAMLESMMGTSLDMSLYTTKESERLNKQIKDIQKSIAALKSGEISYLIQHTEYSTELHPGPSLDNVEEKNNNVGDTRNMNLSEYVKSFGETEDSLLYKLLASNWIQQDYMLYSTTYEETGMTKNAMNFLLHHIDRNKPAFNYYLDHQDIKCLLRILDHRGSTIYGERRVLNISILSYSLRMGKQNYADEMLKLLASMGMEASDFITGYIDEEDNYESLLIGLTCLSPYLPEIVAEVIQDEPKAIQALDVIINHLTANLEYVVNDSLATLLRNHWKEIPTLKQEGLNKHLIAPLYALLDQANVEIDDLAAINMELCKYFIKDGKYTFSRKNLLTAISTVQNEHGKATSGILSLNKISGIDMAIYNTVVKNLQLYLSFLGPKEYSLDFVTTPEQPDDAAFLATFNNIQIALKGILHDEEIHQLIDELLYKRLGSTRVMQLTDQFSDYASTLIKHDAVLFSQSNLEWSFVNLLKSSTKDVFYAWIKMHSSFEQDIASNPSSDDQMELAVHIINLPSSVVKAEKKIRLVDELSLTDYIDVSDIKLDMQSLEQTPDTYALYLKADIIKDAADSFEYISEQPWAVRLNYILQSTQFNSYVSSAGLKPDEACRIICSDDERLNTLRQVLETNFDEYVEGASEGNLLEACKTMLATNQALDDEILIRLASSSNGLTNTRSMQEAGLDQKGILTMLIETLSKMDTNSDNADDNMYIYMILTQLGEPYSRLVDRHKRKAEFTASSFNKEFIGALQSAWPDVYSKEESANNDHQIRVTWNYAALKAHLKDVWQSRDIPQLSQDNQGDLSFSR